MDVRLEDMPTRTAVGMPPGHRRATDGCHVGSAIADHFHRGVRTSGPYRVDAFTLIELLVVITIISILLAVVGVTWQNITGDRLEFNALNTMQGAVRVARARAMELGGDVAVVYDQFGNGAVYLHTPPGHPQHNRGLDAQFQAALGNRYNSDDLFVRDVDVEVASLSSDVRLAPLWLAAPGVPVAARNALSPAGMNTYLLVAIVFDSNGRLRERAVTMVAPSAENLAAGLMPKQIVDVTSQRGCLAFRLSKIQAAIDGTTGLDMRRWLATPDNSATFVVNPWTGRPLPRPVTNLTSGRAGSIRGPPSALFQDGR